MQVRAFLGFFEKTNSRLLSDKHKWRQYFGMYTIVFALICGVAFSYYYLAGRTFIINTDGWAQHYKALVYWARYMRSFLKELLFNQQLVFPEWEFALGEGNDILQTLHYYVIGDPFALGAVFVPTKFMWAYYDFAILLRLYAAGAAFSWLCIYMNKQAGRFAIMAGALCYVFCYWGLINVARHPYFLNPMIYFPLLILGVEKILHKEKPHLFILAVFVSAISNFYFFYMLVILTVLYVAIRLIAAYGKDIKGMALALLRIGSSAVLGVVMSAAILLPVCLAVLGDARSAVGYAFHLFYPLSYYSSLPGLLVKPGDGYWLCLGYAAPAVLALFLLFLRRKEHKLLKVYCLIGIVMMLFPFFGQMLNGFSYMCNRWCWAFSLLSAYIFTTMWPDLMRLDRRDGVKLFGCLAGYFAVCLLAKNSRSVNVFVPIGIALLFLLLLVFVRRTPRLRQVLALAMVIVSIFCNAFFKYSADGANYAAESIEIAKVAELNMNETEAVRQAVKQDDLDDFYRYSGRSFRFDIGLNACLVAGMSSTNFYWTISNPAIGTFRRAMETLESRAYQYVNYDDRTALTTLSSVLYYVVPVDDNAPSPYGFSYMGTFNAKEDVTETTLEYLKGELGEEPSMDQLAIVENASQRLYTVYRNNNPLPLAYTYDRVIGEDTWNTLTALDKQEAMLQGVMLADYTDKTDDRGFAYTSQSMDYFVQCNDNGVTLEDGYFAVTSPNASVTINFEGLPNSETYFSIKGLAFDGASTYELYFGDDKYDPLNLYTKTRWDLLSYKDRESIKKANAYWTEPSRADLRLNTSTGVAKTLTYYTTDNSYYNARHDFLANMHYSQEAVRSITVTFPSAGVYSFDSIDILCQPMANYESQVAALRKDVLENVSIGVDSVEGTISLDKPKYLYFSIPYSTGWTAYVDGEEVPLYQANVKNMAIELGAGDHEVQLIYHTPCLRLGLACSAVGFVIFIVLCVVTKMRKRQYTERNNVV